MKYVVLRSLRNAYIRDGRAPLPVLESTSQIMRANRARNTKPELLLRRTLSRQGIKGYRLNWAKATGRPDVAFPGKKIAIFVNGCFWHRCPLCVPSFPKSHASFWEAKFMRTRERDKRNVSKLMEAGWSVITLWECQLEENANRAVRRIKELLSARKTTLK